MSLHNGNQEPFYNLTKWNIIENQPQMIPAMFIWWIFNFSHQKLVYPVITISIFFFVWLKLTGVPEEHQQVNHKKVLYNMPHWFHTDFIPRSNLKKLLFSMTDILKWKLDPLFFSQSVTILPHSNYIRYQNRRKWGKM